MIYLDHNATTQIAPEVLEAMMPHLTSEWGNPSSTYKFGAKLKAVIETARAHMPNTTNITLHGIESEALLILLDHAGIAASSGSACLADSDEPSHMVKAMKPESTASRQMIRFSLGLNNNSADIQATLAVVRKTVQVLRGRLRLCQTIFARIEI